MTTPRRYVRVAGGTYECFTCGTGHGDADYSAHDLARVHARTCPAVAAAMERDQLRAELDRMRADRDRLRERLHQINPLSKDNDR